VRFPGDRLPPPQIDRLGLSVELSASNGMCCRVTTACAGDLPVPALQVADLSVAGVVVDEVVAGRAVPAGLEEGAAGGVPGGFGRVGVPGSPVRQQA
jgi:hypothetical protein